MRKLNRVDISFLVFGIYSLLIGLLLLFIPNIVLPWFNIDTTNESWIYLLGFVLICSSYYYIPSA